MIPALIEHLTRARAAAGNRGGLRLVLAVVAALWGLGTLDSITRERLALLEETAAQLDETEGALDVAHEALSRTRAAHADALGHPRAPSASTINLPTRRCAGEPGLMCALAYGHEGDCVGEVGGCAPKDVPGLRVRKLGQVVPAAREGAEQVPGVD